MTKVIVRRRPLAAVQDLAVADALRLRLGDVVEIPPWSHPWWARVVAWVYRRLRLPVPFSDRGRWVVAAVDPSTGRVTMVAE